jgi:IS30 family transposase
MTKKKKRLTSLEKGRILQMRNNGNTTFFIMKELGKSRSTINDFILRMSKGGNIERVESSGRKRKTTPRDDKLIARQVLKSRRVSCPSIREDLGFQHVSVRTIQRRIKETGRFVST